MTLLSDVNEGINQARCPCNGPGCPDCNFEVVDLAAGNAPVKDSPLVGSNSGVSTSARVDAPGIHSSLDHFTNRITRCVDKKLGRETGLAEVGQ